MFHSVSISTGTFDVQNIEPLEDPPGNFCVHCIFANGSNAKGCHIKLEETMSESRAYRNTSSPTCFEVAEGGNYTLIVYDIEETSEISTQAAIKTTIIAMGPIVTGELQVKMGQVHDIIFNCLCLKFSVMPLAILDMNATLNDIIHHSDQ